MKIGRKWSNGEGWMGWCGFKLEQYLLMKINLIQTVVVAWVALCVTCLHLQQQPRVYDPDKYVNALQSIQDQLSTQLNDIKQQFNQLDQSIENAAYDPNQQLRLLQEGIADERDSLYQIQQYLTLPFNQRSCQCFNFTDDLRANLTQKLVSVNQSLDKVTNKAKECKDCEIAVEVQTQIQYQQGYLKTMMDTVNAKCCKIYTTLFKDNLNASNWMYGNFNSTQYQKWINQKIKNATTNTTITRICPPYSPYTSSDFKTCNVCDDQNLIFNLQSRLCQICPVGKIFNYDTHRCEFNVVCPIGSKFNQNTIMCEKIQPSYNDSLCPPNAPVWNPQTLGCSKCSSQTPYFDTKLGKCTTCPQDYVYSPQSNQCRHKSCESGQVYNQVTKKCEAKTETSTETTNSQCPETKPFWDKNSLSCSRCPVSQPFYNTTSKKCQACPEGTNYDSSRNVCTKVCLSGQILNPTNLQCQNVTQPQQPDNNNGTYLSLCPPDRPIWNSETKSCSQCAQQNPFWNEVIGACQKCPIGQTWNETLKKCQKQKKVECPSGTVLNSNTGQCDQSNGNSIGYCPPDRPFYNAVLMACTQCPKDKPNYDAATNQCQGLPVTKPQPITCPDGFAYDEASKVCKQTSTSNWTMAQCPPSAPVWSESLGRCVNCSSGQQWNTVTKACENCADPAKCVGSVTPVTPSVNTTCPFNYQWNSTLVKCVKCQQYQKYNSSTKQCDNICKPGEFYDSNYAVCLGTISKCPYGLIFNDQKLRCECSQGANFRYVEQDKACEQFCSSTEYYDYLEQKCYPL